MTIRPSSHNDEKPPTLASLGLKLDSLTPTMAVSRYPQPLCGAILDQKYLLIGTVNGLDFLPLQQVVNGKSGGTKKVTRPLKPISLIKKTKVKDLAVLETRSNILLAIAGRNDHLRGPSPCLHSLRCGLMTLRSLRARWYSGDDREEDGRSRLEG